MTETFDLQHKREQAQVNLLEQIEKIQNILNQFQTGYQQQYKEASRHLLELSDIKPLEWPSLSDERQNQATRAR